MMHERFAVPVADGFRRTMLMVIIVMALLGTVIGWYIMARRGLASPALNMLQVVNISVLGLLLLATWFRWLPQRVIEFCCLLFAVAVCAVCMLLRMYWPEYGASFDLEPLYLWFPVLYVFAFTLTNHRTGLLVSIGILVLFLCVSLPYLVHDMDGPAANITVQLHVVSAALIATLYFFSGYQHRLRQAQVKVDRLAHLSNTDELTGLSNRRGMAAVIEGELARFAQAGEGFAVMLFDIDHFKDVNDRFGHAAGDTALTALATHAAQAFRGIGALGRWGGDEFVALVRGVGSEEAVRMAEGFCAGVASALHLDDRAMTISCGVTVARAGDGMDGLLQRADAALYAAKRAGRNRAEGILESR